jgi:hypothetical protein
MSFLITATLDLLSKMQGKGHMWPVEKLTLSGEKTAEFSAIAELSAK